MTDLTQPHETGADFGAVDCSVCGKRRELELTPYGSLVPAACSCGGEAPKEAPEEVEIEEHAPAQYPEITTILDEAPMPIQEGPEGVPPIQNRPEN
jgi:hypothetical protein